MENLIEPPTPEEIDAYYRCKDIERRAFDLVDQIKMNLERENFTMNFNNGQISSINSGSESIDLPPGLQGFLNYNDFKQLGVNFETNDFFRYIGINLRLNDDSLLLCSSIDGECSCFFPTINLKLEDPKFNILKMKTKKPPQGGAGEPQEEGKTV